MLCISGYSSKMFAFVVKTQPQPHLCPSPQFQRLHPLAPLMKVLPSILGKRTPPPGLSRSPLPHRFGSPASGFRTLSLCLTLCLSTPAIEPNTQTPFLTCLFSPEFSLHSVLVKRQPERQMLSSLQ